MEVKTLKNPPITEALLEIRFNPNKNVTVDKLKGFAEAISEVYPKQEPVEIQSFEFMYSKQAGQKHDFNIQPSGYKLTNAQGNRIVISAIDKFVVSFLPPYTPWPDLRETAEKLYKKYLNSAPQTQVTRLGMRYINQVKLPLTDEFRLEKYINTYQPLPKYEGLPEALSGFETIVTMPHEDIGSTSIIRQVLLDAEGAEGHGPRYLTFVLDIDVYKKESFEVTQEEKIWETFEKMRLKKNAIFFGTFTDLTIAAYE